MKFIILLLAAISAAHGAALDELYGYVDVRDGVHMFWVNYEVNQTGGDWTDYPLILWLQGGPGSSGVGYGNFWELGPYYVDYTTRYHAWTNKANVMFVDNPVGSGYSYVDDEADLTTTNEQIGADLVALLTGVYAQYSDFEQMPFYIYAESYGGKMTIDFALQLLDAIDAGTINCDFKGVGLIDSWISPMDSVNTWAPFLDTMGFVDEKERDAIAAAAAVTQAEVDAGNWVSATNEWYNTEMVILRETGGINFYNVHTEEDIYSYSMAREGFDPRMRNVLSPADQPFDESLTELMNSQAQRDRWEIPAAVASWGFQSDPTFNTLAGDFMKPVVDGVVELLDTGRVHVSVITGNLDLICDTPGTYLWINNMAWSRIDEFKATARFAMDVDEYSATAYYQQRLDNFSVFTLLRSGHMTPMDVPTGSLTIIDQISAWADEIPVKKK